MTKDHFPGEILLLFYGNNNKSYLEEISTNRSLGLKHFKEIRENTTAKATGRSLNKRFNEQYNGCAGAL